MGLTLALRFYRLDSLPPGLHYDEGFNGNDAYALLSTPLRDWPLFFTGNFGREPLFMYLLGLSERLLGPTVLALRIPTAVCGALLIPALVWLAWELGPMLGLGSTPRGRRRFALWAGLATLGLLWSHVFARYAIRAGLYVLLEVLFFAALLRAWQTNRRWLWALAGVLAGLAFYTYLPVRLLPLVFILPLAVLLWQRPAALKARLAGLLLAAGLALLVAAPLAVYFIRNPVSFMTRLDQVSILDKGLAALWANVNAVAGMTVVAGDSNPRNNLPGRPVLDVLTAVPFFLGLLFLCVRWRRPAAVFVLSWLGVMCLPTVLSELAPSFLRAIGAMPVFALIIAVGLEAIVAWAVARLPRGRPYLAAAGWLLLLGSVALGWRALITWSEDPDLFGARDAGFTALAATIADDTSGRPIYLSPRGAEQPTVRYLLSGQDRTLRGFDGMTCVRIAGEAEARYVFLVREDTRGPGLLQSYLPDASRQTLVFDPAGQEWAVAFDQPAGGRVGLPEMIPSPLALADGVELLGYWLSDTALQPGQILYVRLFWRATATPSKDYTTFVQLLAEQPDGTVVQVAGGDGQPGNGSCNTASWQPGETIISESQVAAPDDLPRAGYSLVIGFYDLASGQRLAVPGRTNDQVVLTTLRRAE